MQNRNIIIFVAAIFIAGIAVLLINAYLSGVEEKAVTQAEEQRLVRIVVATQPLEFGAPLTPENVRLQNFPAGSVPEGAFRDIKQALANGRVALRPIVPGEPILADKVSGTDGRAVLAANIPEGMRAVSIPVGAVTGVSGFVRPGDTVDVLLTRKIPGEGAKAEDLMSDVILQRVQVLAIDQIASESATEPKVGQTAVLLVPPFEAQRLAVAGKLGTLSLALRNVETVDPGSAGTITNRDVGNSRYYIAERRQRAASAQPAAPAQPGSYQPVQTPVAVVGGKPAISGPSMTIYRGTEGEEYAVSRRGGK
ncbi:hypothetical protein GCM10023115_00160 [Pontixanthobacter gangjinensis]|uniref:Flp pilus assembly protein CpaB n=1 Tax=Pontixanthobacter gangjinensis TaxID=1028742 RepID=A0A6I4SJD9_9SPHN|nr:Flp pilus assembly protein CpaB [Pontixanthobacter gangjinensis]MXO55266.1 Flp pilus assembly protein CpaB [Pontixanthobacter gangjinensis]